MKTTLAWLLAGGAAALLAGTAIAAETKDAKDETRVEERRTVRIYRADGPEGGQRVVIDRDGQVAHRDRVVVRHGGHGEGRSKYLSAVLQLRADQEPALKAFLDATRGERGKSHAVRFDRSSDDRSTAERLAEMEAKMAEQQASMKSRIDATRAFYNQLDSKQKKAFDAMPMLMMVGPGLGPIMLPGPMPMPVAHRGMQRFEFRHFDDNGAMLVPPVPPATPVPPRPPRL